MTLRYKKHISKEEINLLPTFKFPGKIEVIENRSQAIYAAKKLLSYKALGFDTETRPSFTKGEYYSVSLLQLASKDCVYLFRLNKFKLIPEITEILENPDIIKTGVAVRDDLKNLQKLLPFLPKGFVDLSDEAKKHGMSVFGLRALTAVFLGKRLSKEAKLSNWDRVDLTVSQLHYAANDALVGLMIYEKMIEEFYQSLILEVTV